MNSESELVISLWEAVSNLLPASKRLEAAVGIIRAVEGYGIDIDDLGHISDEDPLLAKAYAEVAPENADDASDYDSDEE